MVDQIIEGHLNSVLVIRICARIGTAIKSRSDIINIGNHPIRSILSSYNTQIVLDPLKDGSALIDRIGASVAMLGVEIFVRGDVSEDISVAALRMNSMLEHCPIILNHVPEHEAIV